MNDDVFVYTGVTSVSSDQSNICLLYTSSPRAQADRAAYKQYMKEVLEHCENLSIRQGEAAEILTQEGKVSGVLCVGGALYETRALVVCTGTLDVYKRQRYRC